MNNLTPRTTIITFDLHDVLVQHDYRTMVKLFWSMPKRWRFFIALVQPQVLWHVIRMRQQGAVAEHILVFLTSSFSALAPYKEWGMRILNAQKPLPLAITLLNELHSQGYELHLFSNIGEQLCTELIKQEPSLFAHFSAIHTTRATNKYLPKPERQAFLDYLTRHNKDQKKVIFIDNNKKNIRMAKQCGMIGIVAQNICQVRTSLYRMLNTNL